MKKNNSFIAAHSTMMEMTTNISITLTYTDTEITREVSCEPSPPQRKQKTIQHSVNTLWKQRKRWNDEKQTQVKR